MKDLISKIYEVQSGKSQPQNLSYIEHAISEAGLMIDDNNIYRFLLDVLNCREHNVAEYDTFGFKVYVFSLLHLRVKNAHDESVVNDNTPDYSNLLKNFENYDYVACFDGGEKHLNRCVFISDIFCLLQLAKEYNFQLPNK